MVNNIAYSLAYLIPFVFFFKKRRWLGIGFILLILYYIILGSKRGAFVTGSIGVLIFAYYSMRTIDLRYQIRSYLLTIIGIGIMGYYAFELFAANEYLIQRLESTGGGAARNFIRSEERRVGKRVGARL